MDRLTESQQSVNTKPIPKHLILIFYNIETEFAKISMNHINHELPSQLPLSTKRERS